jgi:prolyl oligopeptidase
MLLMALVMASCATPGTGGQIMNDKNATVDKVDEFEYLENDDESLALYLSEQQNRTQDFLSKASKTRKQLVDDIKRRLSTSSPVQNLVGAGPFIFFRMNNPNEPSVVLARSSLDRPREIEVLIKPTDFVKAELKPTLTFVVPSRTGRYLVFGITTSGSEFSNLYVYDSEKRTTEPGSVPNTRAFPIGFDSMDTGFTYTVGQGGNSRTPQNGFVQRKVRYHKHGSSFSSDKEIFGYGVKSSPGIDEQDAVSVHFTKNSKFLIGVAYKGTSSFRRVFYKETKDILNQSVEWKLLFDESEQSINVRIANNDVFVSKSSTNGNLEFSRYIFESSAPRKEKFFEESTQFSIDQYDAADDAFYASDRQNMKSRLLRVSYKTGKVDVLKTGEAYTFYGLRAHPNLGGIHVEADSASKPTQFMRYDPRSGWQNIHPVLSQTELFEIEEALMTAKAPDGVEVPFTVVSKKGTRIDHNTPVLLKGYGAYGTPMVAAYSASTLTWLSQGGIEVYCHARGGGEFGAAWHKAGKRQNKMNTAIDLISCAEALLQNGANPKRLGLFSESAGGIPVGYIFVKRPELFGAVSVANGLMNLAKLDKIPIGKANHAEFGNPGDPVELKLMKAMDGYELMAKNANYPPILLSVGAQDTRISAWMSAKFIAKLTSLNGNANNAFLRTDFSAGHGAADMQDAVANRWGDILTFFLMKLKAP